MENKDIGALLKHGKDDKECFMGNIRMGERATRRRTGASVPLSPALSHGPVAEDDGASSIPF
jgi:hypothetical protein